jgi:hypothetical protein
MAQGWLRRIDRMMASLWWRTLEKTRPGHKSSWGGGVAAKRV